MKDILIQLIQSDTSSNKSATRYLNKTHPELWLEILKLTDFLPDTAKPKQRVWHIMNNIWQIPLCPVTNNPVKWCENRYLTTKDHKARRKFQELRGDFKNSHTPEINEKRRQSNLEAVLNGRKYRSKSTYTKLQTENQRKTFLKKYGVDNPSKNSDVKLKISNARIKNGATPKELRTDRRRYYEEVWKYTNQSWKDHFDDINPARLNRSEMALDHIFSIQAGFMQNVPPCWLGHWTNLRLITIQENSKKDMGCDKTLDQLIEDATNSQSAIYPISLNTNSLRQKERYADGDHNFVGLSKRKVEDGSSNLLTEYCCPRCSKTGKGPVMFRHHFDNCKL
jgi:hypothetical protein